MKQSFQFCPSCGELLVDKMEESFVRRACPSEECGFVHYNNPTPVVAILVQHGEDALLARNHQWPPKMFSLITGFVEQGEDPAVAAVRETQEELGLEAVGEPSLIGIYPFVPFNQLLLCYHLEATGEVVMGEELAEFRRIPLSKLKGWEYGPGLAVKDWLSSQCVETTSTTQS